MEIFIYWKDLAKAMNQHALASIGLTRGEVKVYLALLGVGQSSTGSIAKEAQVSRSKLYLILDKLAKKGLVGSIVKGKVRQFSAMEPKRILEYAEEKEREMQERRKDIEKMIPELELKLQLQKRKTDAILFEGFKAIKNFYMSILNELHSGETYYVIGASYGENAPGMKAFFQSYHTQRASKGICVKMLANIGEKGRLVPAALKKSEVRFLPEYLVTNMITVFFKDKAFIFFLTEEPKGFLVLSAEMSRSFTKYFDTFWKLAKR